MLVTKSAGSSARSTYSRKVILGWMAVTTTGACSSSPPASTTPVARPPSTSTRSPRGVGAHGAAEAERRAVDGVGDRPHAALGEAPAAQVAIADLADRVVAIT